MRGSHTMQVHAGQVTLPRKCSVSLEEPEASPKRSACCHESCGLFTGTGMICWFGDDPRRYIMATNRGISRNDSLIWGPYSCPMAGSDAKNHLQILQYTYDILRRIAFPMCKLVHEFLHDNVHTNHRINK